MTQVELDFINERDLNSIDSNVKELGSTYKEAVAYTYYRNINWDIYEYRKRFLELTTIADSTEDKSQMSLNELAEYVTFVDWRANGNIDPIVNARMIQYNDQLNEFIAGA